MSKRAMQPEPIDDLLGLKLVNQPKDAVHWQADSLGHGAKAAVPREQGPAASLCDDAGECVRGRKVHLTALQHRGAGDLVGGEFLDSQPQGQHPVAQGALSTADTFACVIAQTRGWTLLTGDGGLRAVAEAVGLPMRRPLAD